MCIDQRSHETVFRSHVKRMNSTCAHLQMLYEKFSLCSIINHVFRVYHHDRDDYNKTVSVGNQVSCPVLLMETSLNYCRQTRVCQTSVCLLRPKNLYMDVRQLSQFFLQTPAFSPLRWKMLPLRWSFVYVSMLRAVSCSEFTFNSKRNLKTKQSCGTFNQALLMEYFCLSRASLNINFTTKFTF